MLTTARVVKDLTEGGVVFVDGSAAGGADLDGADLDGADLDRGLVLRLAFFEAQASVRRRSIARGDDDDHVFFDGALPAGVGRARLRHQGAMSGLAQLREQKLGIKEVDDAFIVNVDDDGFALLTRCRDELSLLVKRGVSASSTIEIDGAQLRMAWPGDLLADVPRFWERLVSLRVGG